MFLIPQWLVTKFPILSLIGQAFSSNLPVSDPDDNTQDLYSSGTQQEKDFEHLMVYVAGTGAKCTDRSGSSKLLEKFDKFIDLDKTKYEDHKEMLLQMYGERIPNSKVSYNPAAIIDSFRSKKVAVRFINGISGNTFIKTKILEELQRPLASVLQECKPKKLTIVTFSRGVYACNILNQWHKEGIIPKGCEVHLIWIDPAYSKIIDPESNTKIAFPKCAKKLIIFQSKGTSDLGNGGIKLHHPAIEYSCKKEVQPKVITYDVEEAEHNSIPREIVFDLTEALEEITETTSTSYYSLKYRMEKSDQSPVQETSGPSVCYADFGAGNLFPSDGPNPEEEVIMIGDGSTLESRGMTNENILGSDNYLRQQTVAQLNSFGQFASPGPGDQETTTKETTPKSASLRV